MDSRVFEGMDNADLRKYIEFLLWHYRVVDAFWYINVTEKFDQPTADELNEQVWRRAGQLAAKDIKSRFNIKEKGLEGFVKVQNYYPWCILVGYRVEVIDDHVVISVPSCVTQEARLKRGLSEYDCKEMHRGEFEGFSKEVDDRIHVECLFAPPDPHPKEMFCQWRFTLEE